MLKLLSGVWARAFGRRDFGCADCNKRLLDVEAMRKEFNKTLDERAKLRGELVDMRTNSIMWQAEAHALQVAARKAQAENERLEGRAALAFQERMRARWGDNAVFNLDGTPRGTRRAEGRTG